VSPGVFVPVDDACKYKCGRDERTGVPVPTGAAFGFEERLDRANYLHTYGTRLELDRVADGCFAHEQPPAVEPALAPCWSSGLGMTECKSSKEGNMGVGETGTCIKMYSSNLPNTKENLAYTLIVLVFGC